MYDDIALYLVGTLVVLILLIIPVVLPIIALVRTQRIGALQQHVEDLEDEVTRLRRQVRKLRDGATSAPERVSEEAVVAEEIPDALPAPTVARERPRRAAPARRPLDAVSLEEWIGRRGLGWAAVVLLLFATAFFIKYAYDNEWVGELGRVAIGIAAGAGFCGAGYYAHRKSYRIFSQMLTAAGIVILYLATFAAFGYYHLMPRTWAGVFLVVLIVETVALAILYDAPAVALMAVIGALLNPVLLSTGHDQYQSLFLYLLVLNFGVVALSLYRPWPAVSTVALLGTQLLFWMWYSVHYHPEKRSAALGFEAAVFALYLVHLLVAHVARKRKADVETLGRIVINAALFATAGYVLLSEDYRQWMGTAAVGLAGLYTALAWVALHRRPEDVWQQLTLIATGLAFVTIAIPLQADGPWIALGWTVEGAALWWFGLRIRSITLRGLGTIGLALGVFRLLLIDLPALSRVTPFVPIFNRFGVPALLIVAFVLFVAVSIRWMRKPPRDFDLVMHWVTSMTGIVLGWLILSVETYQFFTAWGGGWDTDMEWVARTSLSVLWPIYAAVLLGVGFWLNSGRLRWTGLGLFGLTLGKVVLVDMARLPGFYRVTAFLALALILGAVAWGYQRIERARRDAKAEGAGHETV
jgi:uncharacterized membrane protein